MSKTRLLPSAVYIATIGMEICYLFLGLTLLMERLGLSYTALTLILALYPLSIIITFIGGNLGTTRRAIVLSSLLAIIMVSIVAALAIWQVVAYGYPVGGLILQLVFCGLAWWLGNTLLHGEINYRRIAFRFQVGILFLMIFAGVKLFLPLILFFVMASFALSRARWESSLSVTGVLQGPPSWQIVLGSLAVFIPGVLVFLIISPEIAAAIVHWISVAWNSIINLLTSILTSEFLHRPLVQYEPSCTCDILVKEESPPPPPPPSGETAGLPPVILWLFIFAIFFTLLIFIPLTIRKLRAQRKARPANMVSFEFTSIRVSLLRDLINLLLGIVKRLWHSLLSLLKRARTYRPRPIPLDESVLSIRALYRRLLHWAAGQEAPRTQSQTPLEYLKLLCQNFPQNAQELALITDLYLQARYSRRPTTSKEFEAAKRAWERIRLAP